MPKYYFHIREDGELDEDEEGVEYETLDQAYDQARRAALEMRSEQFPNCEDNRIFEITTADGMILREVPFKDVVRF